MSKKSQVMIITVTVFLLTINLFPSCGNSGSGSSGGGTYANIYEAIRAKDLAAVKNFVKQGEDVNQKDAEGRTPLHYAAAYGTREIIEFLLEKGANPNAKDGRGLTPMKVASQMGNTVAEEALDRAGASE